MKESNVDVLIIGAGPAGLMAANAFAAAGVNVRAVDKRCVEGLSITNLLTTLHCISRPSKVAAGQADGIQPRTIEVFQASHIIWASPPCPFILFHSRQSYGLADRLLREGNQMHFAAFYNPAPGGGIAVSVVMAYLPNLWKRVLMFVLHSETVVLQM